LTAGGSNEYIQSILSESRIFVYEKSSTIIGFCGIHETKLSWLFVLAEHRRTGVAGALVRCVLEEYTALSLTVVSLNIAAIRRYESLGFTRNREFEIEFQGQYIGVINMNFSATRN